MKKILSISLALILLAVLTTSPARADRGHDQLIKGVIIGTGAAILGAALIHEIDGGRYGRPLAQGHRDTPHNNRGWNRGHTWNKNREHARRDRYDHRYDRRIGPHDKRWFKSTGPRKPGRYAFKDIWISPRFERHWVAGHFNHQGFWVRGHYKKKMIQKGYWDRQRIRVHSDR